MTDSMESAPLTPSPLRSRRFHCHILPHAESEQGMFGMVTVLVVKPKAVVA
jgi:FtsP/CotA-like multicopper oxidase with cupredoxin domain